MYKTSTEQAFFDLLLMHRQEMTPHTRKKTRSKRYKKRTGFPFGKQREYDKYISNLQKGFMDFIIVSYKKVLDRHLDHMDESPLSEDLDLTRRQIQKELDRLYGKDEKKVRAFITQMGLDISDFNRTQMGEVFAQVIGVSWVLVEPWEKEVIALWAQENFTLIKSLSEEGIEIANRVVSDGVLLGKPSGKIQEELQQGIKKISGSRASLIARDQTAKLNNRFSRMRQQDVGVKYYFWSTSADERVRPSHAALDGSRRSWDMSPIPEEEIRCRCEALPDFDELLKEADEEIDKEI